MESNKKSDTDLDDSENEKFVESWLNEHPSWFEMYVLENVDLNTVEKWLRINDKKICKCNFLNESNSKNAFARRKSCIPGVVAENGNETLQCSQKENNMYNPIRSEGNKYINNLARSSSFDSLFFEKMSKKIDDEENHTVIFNLEEDGIDKDEFMVNMNILERSVFSKSDSASNSQLLKLLKSKIKLPNIGKKLSFMEKMDEKKKICGNMFELLVMVIQDTAREVLPKEASETIKTNLKVLVNCEYSSVLLFDKIHNKLYSYCYDQLFSKCNESEDFLFHDFGTQIDANCALLGNVIRKGKTIILNPDQLDLIQFKNFQNNYF
ncbi:hypothetical protein BpHYR1_029005 [Brachionus plicatilis]|uniref:Uncharacterized protein n=1 Tax=Brachionus plicatilis TaxID=10195 RepID=A0A3M7SW35_BRAPC|nr:hypothetical protein BpHYR1_029005 [Brachionus plicatilis]